MQSVWHQNIEIPHRPALEGTLRADAAVIGAGMAGVLTARFLADAGLSVVVLEACRIGSGQTGRTTAKITSQHGLCYEALTRAHGAAKARLYAQANERAIDDYRSMAGRFGGCGWRECAAYIYTRKDPLPLEAECAAVRAAGIDASLTRTPELPFAAAALRFPRQACFDPLRFLAAAADGLRIYENTPALDVQGGTVKIPSGEVHAGAVCFCCHYPFINSPGYYFMRMHQQRSYVLALEDAPLPDGMYLGADENGYSLRAAGKYLLLGGAGHRAGENTQGGRYSLLRAAARKYFPSAREAAHWSAQDCIPLDGMPYIGRFSAATPNWYVATGFQKWGMTSSMVSARILTALVTGEKDAAAELFSPQRFTPSASAVSLMEETLAASKGLARRFVRPPRAELDALAPGHGGIVSYDGEKVGAYRDEAGEVYLVAARCPHLGCELSWNPDEKSFDCPCHGSRFDYLGRRIDGPAQTPIAGEPDGERMGGDAV